MDADGPAGTLLHPPGHDVTACAATVAPSSDLGLDRVATALFAGRHEYHLDEWFWTPLTSVAAVVHRQEAMADLEVPEIRAAVREFSAGLAAVLTRLSAARSFRHVLQRQSAQVDAATTYTATVTGFADHLRAARPASQALSALADRVAVLAASPRFRLLASDATAAHAALATVRYRLRVAGDRVQVSLPSGTGTDYSAEIAAVFDRVRQGSIRSHVTRPAEHAELSHLEEAILERVAALHPHPFELLARFAADHRDFLDRDLLHVDRELQFLLAGLGLAERLRAAGLPVCWPEVSRTDGTIELRDARDPALTLTARDAVGGAVVGNDVALAAGERVAVVTGPNQGGKTTFARMLGAITHLAALGFPVPAASARLPLPDAVLTHFGRAEDLADLRGALEDDLVRLRAILRAATPDSLVILNELFSSTAVADAEQLSRATLEQVLALGCRCIWVTFLTEVAATPGVVSLVSQVDAEDPSRRTFRVLRQDPGGPTWAESLAVALGLDRESLRRRLAR